MEVTMAGRQNLCPGGVPCNTHAKEETGKMERSSTRCQGPGAKVQPEGITLMMTKTFIKCQHSGEINSVHQVHQVHEVHEVHQVHQLHQVHQVFILNPSNSF